MSTTSSDCWVTFWENDGYDGDTRTFSGPTSIDDLAEYDYDGSSKEMDDSINSVKTGSSTWLVAFSRHNFDGSIWKTGPATAQSNLNDVGIGNNTIVSFATYDAQPNFWDVTDSTSAGTCWVKLYAGERFQSELFTIRGAGPVVSLDCMAGFEYVEMNAYGENVTSHHFPESLVTGPSTWVKLYSDTGLRTLVAQLGPNMVIDDLSQYATSLIWSLEVFDSEPAGFVQTGSAPGVLLAVQRHQTSKSLEKLLAGVLRSVPKVGGLLSGLLGILWPDGPTDSEIWNDMVDYMNAMVEGLIDENNLQQLSDLLAGYYDDIQTFLTMEAGPSKVTKLSEILNALETDQHLFLDMDDPASNMTWLVAFGTISVAMLAERAYNYALISDGADDPDADQARAALDDAIRTLTSAVDSAVSGAVTWRKSQVSYTESGDVSTSYVLTDAYTGYSITYSRQSDAEANLTKLQQYVADQYTSLLTAYVSPSSAWAWFGTANTEPVTEGGSSCFPSIRFLQVPTAPALITATAGNLGADSGVTSTQTLAAGDRIERVVLYAGTSAPVYVTGVQITYAQSGTVLYGTTSSSAVDVTLDADENIIAVYGGSGSYMDQLYLRTDKGRDFGVGGDGGLLFFTQAPQGVALTLVSVSAVYQSCLNSLTLTWQYEVIPRLPEATSGA